MTSRQLQFLRRHDHLDSDRDAARCPEGIPTMSIQRVIAAVSVTSLLFLSSCISDPSVSGTSADGGSTSAESSPTATVFEQQLSTPIAGQRQVITPTTQHASKKFRAVNIGVSFESTTLADARLNPGTSNLDEILNSLGSPALRFGGNALDRRTFWTSKGGAPMFFVKG